MSTDNANAGSPLEPPDPKSPLDTNTLLQLILQQQQQQQALQAQLIQALSHTDRGQERPSGSNRGPDMPPPPPRIKSLPVPILSSPDDQRISQFRAWKTKWEDYYNALQLERQPIMTQHAHLRSALDEEWIMLWSSERLLIGLATPIDEILTMFEEYIRKRRNPLLDRQEFFLRNQQSGETTDRYYANLRLLDDACAHDLDILCPTCSALCTARCSNPDCTTDEAPLFPLLQNTRIRDRLICGLSDKELQRRILAKQYNSIVNMDAVLSVCSAHEQSSAAGAALSIPPGPATIAVTKSSYKKQQSASRHISPQRSSTTTSSTNNHSPCYWCGKRDSHSRNECPALDHKCKHCKVRGHWESVCRNPNRHRGRSASPSPRSFGAKSEFSSMQNLRTNTIRVSSAKMDYDRTLLPISVTSADFTSVLPFLCDTGADADVMGYVLFRQLSIDACFEKTFSFGAPKMEAANNTILKTYGKLEVTLELHGLVYTTELFICHGVDGLILSKTGCQRLGLIPKHWPHSMCATSTTKLQLISVGIPQHVPSITASPSNISELRTQLIQEYASVFQDDVLKPMKGPAMHISLVEGAHPCRRYKAYSIPIHWKRAVKEQLDAMEHKGVIERVPVGESYDWCHPMVVVPKKGSNEPRITVDLTGLNKYVRRPAYPTKIPREVVAAIPPGQQYFTSLDARHGYWQVALDEESKKLTTFITPWGSYRFQRNVMGLISAGDESNRRGDEAFQGLSHVDKVVEDILLYGKSLDDHVQRVRDVLQRCLENNITLNAKKFNFAVPEIDFCGFRISSNGYTPSPHLVSALLHFPVPKSKTDVKSFLGLVQQFETFSSQITEMSAPMRALLPKDAAFVWDTPHQHSFEAVIGELTSSRVLAHFIPGRPLRLETDAAQSKGLGFALWQQQEDDRWKLIQTGSRSVTSAESHYSATEIELLAVTYAVRKCRMFLLGHSFHLIVDHRPLVSIINAKTLDQIENPRLQRLKEKLLLYSIIAVWRPGTKHTVVDVFSRFPVSPADPDDAVDEDDPCKIFSVSMIDGVDSSLIVPDRTLASVREVAASCAAYQKLINHINSPALLNSKWEDDIQPYFKYKDDLKVSEGLLFYGVRLLIPQSLRKHILQLLHLSHQGIERTLRRARQSVFWPGINNDVQNMVRSCVACQNLQPSQQKEPLLQEQSASYPFQIVGTDIFSFAGYEYLVVVDKFSGWPSIAKLGSSSTTSTVISHLVQLFTDTGIPEILHSDNGPQFASLQFSQWCQKWGITHRTSSPHYPQSNGLAESAVKAMKYLLMKTSPKGDCTSEEFRLGLLEFRNTPRADGYSPAQVLLGSPARSLVPLHRSQYSHTWRQSLKSRDMKATRLKQKAEDQYNVGARPLSELQTGVVVRVQDPSTGRWNVLAEVVESVTPRSYLLRTEAGRIIRRNRRFLRIYYPSSVEESSTPETPPRNITRRSSRPRRPPTRFVAASYRAQRSLSEERHEV